MAKLHVHNNPTGDLGDIAGVKVRNGKGLCQGGKPGTGKLYNDVCLCGSAHTSGCVVDGLSATAAYYYYYCCIYPFTSYAFFPIYCRI